MKMAYVICCNDNIKHVFIGSIEGATKKMIDLREELFQLTIWQWEPYRNRDGEEIMTRSDTYLSRCYWHIHTVPLTEETQL